MDPHPAEHQGHASPVQGMAAPLPADLDRLARQATTRCLTGCYGLTMRPLLAGGTGLRAALGLALAADTISITVMETVDNATLLLVPGAMEAGLGDPLFWAALAGGFAIAWVVTYPINRWLITRGRGHAVVHGPH